VERVLTGIPPLSDMPAAISPQRICGFRSR
jgi:hypothetical protein